MEQINATCLGPRVLLNKSVNWSSVFTYGVTISLLVKENIEEQNPAHHSSIVKESIEEQNPASQQPKPDEKKYQTTVRGLQDQIHPLLWLPNHPLNMGINTHNIYVKQNYQIEFHFIYLFHSLSLVFTWYQSIKMISKDQVYRSLSFFCSLVRSMMIKLFWSSLGACIKFFWQSENIVLPLSTYSHRHRRVFVIISTLVGQLAWVLVCNPHCEKLSHHHVRSPLVWQHSCAAVNQHFVTKQSSSILSNTCWCSATYTHFFHKRAIASISWKGNLLNIH